MSDPLKWKLIYQEDTTEKKIELGQWLIPAEAMETGNAYADCSLVWGSSPEGHLHAVIPSAEFINIKSASLILRNPYYDYWKRTAASEEAE